MYILCSSPFPKKHNSPRLGIFRNGYVVTVERLFSSGDIDGPVVLLILASGFGTDDIAHIHKWGYTNQWKIKMPILPGGTDSKPSLQNSNIGMPLVTLQDGSLYILYLNWDPINASAASLFGVLSKELAPVRDVEPFERLCPNDDSNCILQSGSNVKLQGWGDRLMNGARYNILKDDNEFGGLIDTMVVSHSVQVRNSNGNYNAGVRWYEIRGLNYGDDADDPFAFNQGTHAPEYESFGGPNVKRWLPTIAMDGGGNIAIMYSISNPDQVALHVSLAFTGRYSGDDPGRMTTGEGTVALGQSASSKNKWGNYFSMVVDPNVRASAAEISNRHGWIHYTYTLRSGPSRSLHNPHTGQVHLLGVWSSDRRCW